MHFLSILHQRNFFRFILKYFRACDVNFTTYFMCILLCFICLQAAKRQQIYPPNFIVLPWRLEYMIKIYTCLKNKKICCINKNLINKYLMFFTPKNPLEKKSNGINKNLFILQVKANTRDN